MLPFYHPTTVLFVDDDMLFLESCAFRYGRQFPCLTLKSPSAAISAVSNSATEWTKRLKGQLPTQVEVIDEPSGAGTRMLRQEARSIIDLVHDPRRFDTISVAVIDYAMPNMTGLDLFQAVRHLPVGRILLTGKAGVDVAVDAFNQGLIHQYLIKQDPDVSQKLPREISRLQQQFFESEIGKLWSWQPHGQQSVSWNASLSRTLAEIAADFGSVEHYFNTAPYGFVLVNADGACLSVLLCDDDTLQAHGEIASSLQAPVPLLEQLSQGGIVPCFPTENGYYHPSLEHTWKRYLLSAKEMNSTMGRWWISTTDRADLLSPDLKCLRSFSGHLRDIIDTNGSPKIKK
jgi:CheY-like chemotaxis protein